MSPGLGLSLGGAEGPDQAARHRRLVDLAETLGLHSVWLPEMHFQPGVCPAPLMELAGHAATTRRLRLGTTSLLLPLHPPETLAVEIATLDRLSGGRLLVGLGRGFQKPMLEAFGVPPAQKRDRFDDALARMRAVWAASRDEDPARPHPPLAVAAFGPKGLAQAARHGLPYLASPVETFDQIAENQRCHRDQLPAGAPEPLQLLMRTLFVSTDAGEQQAARLALGREMSGARRGMPAAVDRALDAPLEDRALIGTPDEVLERLILERQRIGIDLLVTRPLIANVADDALERSLRLLAEEVWPRFKASTPPPASPSSLRPHA
jgi:alkanesulfonate monooxygenase SsuD/methylene tetrahydromethanopterin reductase-like flavin-dependent oxidoreductase (luciferase family)